MWLITLILIHFFFLTNTRFTLWPEMVVYPYLVNNDFLLYRDIINPYPPAVTYFLAAINNIFGYQQASYKILTWVMVAVVDLLVFDIARKISGKIPRALIALAFFVVISIPFGINGLWFDLVQTPFILLAFYAFYLFLQRNKNRYFFFSIFFLTVAFFIKQQVVWLALWFFVVVFLKFGQKAIDFVIKNAYVTLAFIILFVLHLIFFAQKRLVADFLYWVIYFPFFKASTMPGYILLPTLKQFTVVGSLILIFVPAISKKQFNLSFAILTGVVLIFFAYPRFDFFHLIPALSILSIALGVNLSVVTWKNIGYKTISILGGLILTVFTVYYLLSHWSPEVRFFEPEIIKTAGLLRNITKPSEPVYIQNGPDQLLPLASRLPPKPWADEFPWYLEMNSLQEEVVEGIIRASPKYVIFKPYEPGDEYQIGAYRPQKIVNYLDGNYQNLAQISEVLWLKVKK